MAKVLYFSGATQLGAVTAVDARRFLAIGGIPSKHNRVDTFTRMVGHPAEGPDAVLPVDRVIFRKANPSNHKCDARCLNATGQQCECSCGGKNHGAKSNLENIAAASA